MNRKKKIIATLIKAGRPDLANAVARFRRVRAAVTSDDIEEVLEGLVDLGETVYEAVIINAITPLNSLGQDLSDEAFDSDLDFDVMAYSYLFGKGVKRINDAVRTIQDTGKTMAREMQKMQKELKKVGVK